MHAYSIVMDTRSHDEVGRACWFIMLVPGLFGSAVQKCDVFLGRRNAFVAVTVKGDADLTEPQCRARLSFWADRAGGWPADLQTLSPSERMALANKLKEVDWRAMEVPLKELASVVEKLGRLAALPDAARADILRGPRISLGLKRAPGVLTVSNLRPEGLFVESAVAPPVSDTFNVLLPLGNTFHDVAVRVVNVRRQANASEGKPAGFGCVFASPTPQLLEALACHGATEPEHVAGRQHPRYAVTARIRYSDEETYSSDYVSNLSFGGAFVQSRHPAAVDEQIPLEIELPSGALVKTVATVVFSNGQGMGVQLRRDPETERLLAAELTRIQCRPRRVLVVDDSADWRRILQLQFKKDGVETVTADDGQAALDLLTEELLGLDMVVLDLDMPVMNGLELLRRVRRAGGETELPIVIVTANEDPVVPTLLVQNGADGVILKTTPLPLITRSAIDLATRKRQQVSVDRVAQAPASWG
ncbi:MAG: response regulator [Myxococcota bacterium]